MSEARVVGFGEAIKAGYGSYFNFSGRATRAEFWWFALWESLLLIASGGPAATALVLFRTGNNAVAAALIVVATICCFCLLATLIPGISIQFRRLHDAGHSGLWVPAYLVLSWTRRVVFHQAHLSGDAGQHMLGLGIALASFAVDITLLVFFLQPSKQVARERDAL
jgi:uncharacterized membrane protein YhaH (DUF805 family)